MNVSTPSKKQLLSHGIRAWKSAAAMLKPHIDHSRSKPSRVLMRHVLGLQRTLGLWFLRRRICASLDRRPCHGGNMGRKRVLCSMHIREERPSASLTFHEWLTPKRPPPPRRPPHSVPDALQVLFDGSPVVADLGFPQPRKPTNICSGFQSRVSGHGDELCPATQILPH